ncbi:DUF6350 family protein [uncultured Microbacterium sp.]|uniref:cell division protein PerM n=1 Tax=uncultured Microbacterium sp. TaxID=191216 RepID=UPI002610DC50|nr:DUF6350 family protein [uncultured Microbacterium sp.]
MQRLLVAILAAADAAIAAAVGLAVLLAPLTLLWTLVLGADADWGALWPFAGTLWQFGHGVPVAIALPSDIISAVGIAPQAAAFTLSLTPMVFLVFTLLFAARSGARSARSGAGLLGAGAGIVVFAAISTGVALTARVEMASVPVVAAIIVPASVYLVGALGGAVRHAWNEGDGGPVNRLHDLVDGWGAWRLVPGEIVRGASAAVVGLTGIGALLIAIMVALRGGEVVALFESAHVDAVGATVLALGNLAYLPTMIVWAVSWASGAGFSVGAGTSASPAGTELGVVPGLPAFGLLPENGSIWMLVIVLLPVAVGAFAGWIVRSRLVWQEAAQPLWPRVAIAAGIAALTAGVTALAAVLASGSIGPGRMAETGPHPGRTALAVGIEVLIGTAILLIAPRHRDELAEERTDRWAEEMAASATADAETAVIAETLPGFHEGETQPLTDDGFFGNGSTPAPR